MAGRCGRTGNGRTLKILQVMAGAAHGGAETAFIDMCLALHEAGEQIEVITRPNPLRNARLEKAGLKVHELRFGGLWDIHTPRRIKQIITAFKPHIVQTWMSRAAQKTPRWMPGEAMPRYLTVARLGGYYKTSHFKNSDFFTTITPDIKRYLTAHGIPANKIFHINNFAETETMTRPVRRQDFDTPEDATLLLGLGRLHESKAFDTLMRSIHDLPDIYLWIAGEGPDREKLEALRDELSLEQRVRFLGWRDDRAALFEAADICVFSSRYEPFGTVFVQAWAQKVPLITTESDGPRQYVRHEQDGLMVPVDDVSALHDAIKNLAIDPALAQKLVENGWKRYLGEFTKEKTVQAYLTLYNDLLEQEGLAAAA